MGSVLGGHQRVTTRRLLIDTNSSGGPNSTQVKIRSGIDTPEHLVGAAPAIAAQTVAELRYGALGAGWGQRRLLQGNAIVGLPGIEPGTSALSAQRSNRLSYSPAATRRRSGGKGDCSRRPLTPSG